MRYLIYDFNDKSMDTLLDQFNVGSIFIVNATEPVAKCNGCFKCWLKNPGRCAFSDRMQHIGSQLLSSKEIIILCKSLYGGFSVPVKRIIDRMIPGVLPFFEKRNQELHHCKRYDNTPSLKIIFYNANEMTEPERNQAKNMVSAIALNFHAKAFTVVFAVDIQQALQEVNG